MQVITNRSLALWLWRLPLFLFAAVLVTSVVAVSYANRPAATGTTAATTGTFRALLIGVEDFTPDGAGGFDLAFPCADVTDVSARLVAAYNISAANIATAKSCVAAASDLGATSRAGILGSLAALVATSGPNDDVLVYVSGHGTTVFDTFNASGASDGDRERVDNAILTSDNGVILDGELASILAADNAARVIVVLDISFPSGFIDDFRAAFSAATAPELLFVAAARGEASETAVLRNGVFTYWFSNSSAIGGLPGPAFANDDGDGFVNADDLDQNPHANEDGFVTLEEIYDFLMHLRVPFGLLQRPNILDLTTNDVLPD